MGTSQFQNYVVHCHSLRHVFVARKGVYLQADIMGQILTWTVPVRVLQVNLNGAKLYVFSFFVEFYATLLNFVNFRLCYVESFAYLHSKLYLAVKTEMKSKPRFMFGSLDEVVKYSGKDKSKERPCHDGQNFKSEQNHKEINLWHIANCNKDKRIEIENLNKVHTLKNYIRFSDSLSSVQKKISKLVNNYSSTSWCKATEHNIHTEDDSIVCGRVFRGLVFYLATEVHQALLKFVIEAFGGTIASFARSAQPSTVDKSITHFIVDGPRRLTFPGVYVQPQWVFDSANLRKPVAHHPYAPENTLPTHLSPFFN